MRQVPKFKLFTVIMSSELGNNMLAPLLVLSFLRQIAPCFRNRLVWLNAPYCLVCA